jgi:queuosine precursor transporter
VADPTPAARWCVPLALATAAAFVGTVFAANWAIVQFGAVPVGFGLVAPAGVYFAGLAFTLRDLLHEFGGRWAVFAAIAAGAASSALVAPPALVIASAVAFAVSELADMAVYSPLRRRRWYTAVAASNVVGLVVDSALFLWLAFGSLAFLPGQILGKAWMTLAAVAVLAAVRWPRRVMRTGVAT